MDVEFVKCKYEDAYDGIIINNRFRIGVRHIQMSYLLICSIAMGVMRSSNSVGVLALTDRTRLNDTYIQVYNWDRSVQGMILSSFFIGYAFMLVPAELISKVRGKLVISAILVANASLSLTMPTIVNRGGWIAVCNAQFILGMSQACFMPSLQAMISTWLPPYEKKWLGYVISGGVHLGIVIGFPVCGLISESALGWELVYYFQAIMMTSLSVIWILLTSNTPDNHEAMGDAEQEYIRESLKYYKKRKVSVPWGSMLRSPRVWALACAHAAANALFVFYLTDMPAYFMTFNISLKNSAYYSMLPFLGMWVAFIMTVPTVNWMNKLGIVAYLISATNFRKLINFLGAFGVVGAISIMSTLTSTDLVIFAAVTAMGFLGFQLCGFLENHKDISENFAGSVLLITSSFASIVGALVPVVTGFLISNDGDNSRSWRIIIIGLASISLILNTIYTILASSDRQVWDDEKMYRFSNGKNHMELHDMS